MPNYHFAPRGTFAVILPSTNVAVEAEYAQMLVPGISWHSGRILIKNPALDSDEAFEQFMVDLREEIGAAVTSVMTACPDFMVMGMSSETFWGGKAGAAQFETLMKDLSGGLDITTGAQACNAALEVLGVHPHKRQSPLPCPFNKSVKVHRAEGSTCIIRLNAERDSLGNSRNMDSAPPP